MKSNFQTNDIKAEFDELLSFADENEEAEHQAYMLMSGFLSEIEVIQKKNKLSRKELAEKIGISASYLTQVFRNDKPLNFYTLAKISKVLNIKFEIKVISAANANCGNPQNNGKSLNPVFESSQPGGSNHETVSRIHAAV